MTRTPRLRPIATNGHPVLAARNLSVAYRSVEALSDVSFAMHAGQVVGVIGPNGAGKSTLMKAMLGLISASRGQALYGDRPLAEQRDRVAYVPQRSAIDWTYPATAWDVVMMGRVKKTGWFHRFSGDSRDLAVEALERVGALDLRDRPIGKLSGGQQQRVFLARALVQGADAYFFDEPFVGIDKKTEAIIFDIFHELAAAGKTVLVVHHDLGEAMTHFDSLILLDRELIASGSRELVLTATNLDRAYSGKVAFYNRGAA